MNSNTGNPSSKSGEINSFWVLGARLTWALVGPLVLLLITVGIVSSGSGWLTGLDAGFAVVAGLMLLGRWVEQRSGAATTFAGQPAGTSAFARYAMTVIATTALIWVIANAVGNHVLA